MINLVVEGESDREAARALVRQAGHEVGFVRIAGGKASLDPKIAKYNSAAMRSNWVVFRDSDAECPVQLRSRLLSGITDLSPTFHLGIAHSMTEAWLMADRRGFATYFHVSFDAIALDPESLRHAKRELLHLCANSRLRAIRDEVVSSDGQTGPLYVSRLNDFASSRWNVLAAAKNSQSLKRALACLEGLQ